MRTALWYIIDGLFDLLSNEMACLHNYINKITCFAANIEKQRNTLVRTCTDIFKYVRQP